MKRTNGISHFGKWTVMACATFALLFTLSASAAQTKVLKFDNVSTSFQDTIPNGYGGLKWNNFDVVDGVDYVDSGYQAAVISTNYVAFPVGTTNDVLTASISAKPGHFFRLNSGYFTAAWNDDLQLEVIGKQNGRTLFDRTYFLSSTSPTKITFPPSILTSVEFISSGGTPNGAYNGSGVHFAVDNLSVTVQ